MSGITIGGRLSSVAKYVRQGAVFADIGTDHAYLPVFLLLNRTIEAAICSDINEGPLANARQTAAAHGVCEKTDFVLADGAADLSERGITDMAICGMGGELIADIIERAPFIKADRVRLILQPMTRQEYLRVYLYKNGFSLIAEDYAVETGKPYTVLVAEYSGTDRDDKITPEIKYGAVCKTSAAAQYQYLEAKLKSKRSAYGGLKLGGCEDGELLREIAYIEDVIGKLRSFV